MSLKTWKKEFLPTLNIEKIKKMTAIEATQHALNKWTGLLPENMNKHDVAYDFSSICYNNTFLDIASSTCSLCIKYLDGDNCSNCPIFKTVGRSCFENPDGESEYDIYRNRENPEPMIRLLERTLRALTDGKVRA